MWVCISTLYGASPSFIAINYFEFSDKADIFLYVYAFDRNIQTFETFRDTIAFVKSTKKKCLVARQIKKTNNVSRLPTFFGLIVF